MAYVSAHVTGVKTKNPVCKPNTVPVWSNCWGEAAQGIPDPPCVGRAPLIPRVYRWLAVLSLLSAEKYIKRDEDVKSGGRSASGEDHPYLDDARSM